MIYVNIKSWRKSKEKVVIKIKRIACTIELTDIVVESLPKAELKRQVNYLLINELAKYMLDNLEDLPIEISKESNGKYSTYKLELKLGERGD